MARRPSSQRVRKEAVYLCILLVAAVGVLRATVGFHLLPIPLTVLAVWLLVAAMLSERWREHAPYLLCLGGIIYSLLFAFDHIHPDEPRFWLALEQASVAATGILSLCYWLIELFPSKVRPRPRQRHHLLLEFIAAFVGAVLLIVSAFLPTILEWMGSILYLNKEANPRAEIGVFLAQQFLLWLGVLLFAINSFMAYQAACKVSQPETKADGFFSETQRSWVLFYCSDLVTCIIFTFLLVYLCMSFGWRIPEDIVLDGRAKALTEGAIAFFTGAITFQVSFSNGVFYFVNMPKGTRGRMPSKKRRL